MKTVVIAYIPVIHSGYKKFLSKYSGPENELWIIGTELSGELYHFRKEIRALDPYDIAHLVSLWGFFGNVIVITKENIQSIKDFGIHFVMANEDICRHIHEKYMFSIPVKFDDVFLRWDRDYSLKENEVRCDRAVLMEGVVLEMMGRAYLESEKSSDWWRHVGAVISRGNQVLVSGYNRHVPSELTPYSLGDPRNNFKRGIHIEISSSDHAESVVIATAARKGISTYKADLFVTTFPCPPCSKLIARSGIKRIFFKEGYSVLDAYDILKANGVEIIFVK